MNITDEMVQAAAKSDAAFDGLIFEDMHEACETRYTARARLALEVATPEEAQALEASYPTTEGQP